jgi:hypothetical protein
VMDERRSPEPFNRLTRLCAAMTEALEAHPEYREDEKCVVFLHDGETSGAVLHGYDNDIEAMADVFVHMRGVFRANGKDLLFAPLRGGADS